ncbi:MAG: hypothetical protein WAL63_06715 [Solirubrobacteraceae bacterium]
MAGEALFVGWGQVVRGREQLALEVFGETVGFFEELRRDGRIDSVDTFLLAPHAGDLGGFMILHGDQSALDAVRSSPDFLRVIARAGAVVDNLGVVSAYTGDALGETMARFGELSQELPQLS